MPGLKSRPISKQRFSTASVLAYLKGDFRGFYNSAYAAERFSSGVKGSTQAAVDDCDACGIAFLRRLLGWAGIVAG